MKRCERCGTETIKNSQYCDECGALQNFRVEDEQPNEIKNFNLQKSGQPIFQSSNVTSIGVPPLAFESQTDRNSFGENVVKSKVVHAHLTIERGNSTGTEFSLIGDESYIGRWDADNGVFPDVDLDKYDPEAKISRRHARIIRQNGSYLIEDLGSTNGTFVNRGRRLIPGNKTVLNDGDEVIVGKTFLRFIVSEKIN